MGQPPLLSKGDWNDYPTPNPEWKQEYLAGIIPINEARELPESERSAIRGHTRPIIDDVNEKRAMYRGLEPLPPKVINSLPDTFVSGERLIYGHTQDEYIDEIKRLSEILSERKTNK